MKKLLKKATSLLVALVMVLGVMVPAISANAAENNLDGNVAVGVEEENTSANVTIHKLAVDDIEGLPLRQKEGETSIKGLDGETEYTGAALGANLESFFQGKNPKPLEGVKFIYWVFTDEEAYSEMIANSGEYDTEAAVDGIIPDDKLEEKVDNDSTVTNDQGIISIPNINIPAGTNVYIWAIEKSKVISGEEGKTITGTAAVPFGLALPMYKADGELLTDIHVYPKNTTADEPQVDKDFGPELGGEVDATNDRMEIDEPIVENANVGDKIPYEIETLIPAGSSYETAKWTDEMTKGLTFNDDLKVFIGAEGSETELAAGDYEVTVNSPTSFKVELTDSGLAQVNG